MPHVWGVLILLLYLYVHGCTRKHKCKKKHFGPAPCDDCLSEYRNVYVRKPIGPPKSCKPDQTPLMSDAPAEDKTTTRYWLHSIFRRPCLQHVHVVDKKVRPPVENSYIICRRTNFFIFLCLSTSYFRLYRYTTVDLKNNYIPGGP